MEHHVECYANRVQ